MSGLSPTLSLPLSLSQGRCAAGDAAVVRRTRTDAQVRSERRCRHHRPRLCPVPFTCEPKHAWGTLWGCVGEDIRQKVDSKHTKERRENGADAEHVRARSKQREEFSHQTAPWTSPLWTLFLIKLTLSLSPMSRTAESIQLHQIISVPCDGRFQVPLNIN